MKIVYCPGRDNANADTLSCHPLLPALTVRIGEGRMQVSSVYLLEETDKAHKTMTPTTLAAETTTPVRPPSLPPVPGVVQQTLQPSVPSRPITELSSLADGWNISPVYSSTDRQDQSPL